MDISSKLSTCALIAHSPLAEKGEDSYAYDFTQPRVHAQAVFDGCGGAGAWPYAEFGNASGAYVAAQAMAEAFLTWSARLAPGMPAAEMAESFRVLAQDTLTGLKDKCAPMGVSGSLVKAFPCTAAVAVQQMASLNRMTLTTLNAGDSRVYYLTPDDGLVQVTRDESRGNPDPMQSLRDSAPLSNLLNADKHFRVTPFQVELPLPCAVICCSDGMFGFLRSPMDFEHLLLHTLLHARTIAEFEQEFRSQIAAVTGDDSTCVISFYGWKDMTHIRTSLKRRYEYISSVVGQLNAIRDDRAALESALVAHWQIYRKDTLAYERQEG